MKPLLCFEVFTRSDELIQNHIVLDQINNVRKKYLKYGGGIKIELQKGFWNS